MKLASDENMSARGTRKAILGILVVLSLVAAYYFFSLAGFNVWQSAFQENASHLDVLESRVWLFGALSIAFLALGIFLAVMTLRRR